MKLFSRHKHRTHDAVLDIGTTKISCFITDISEMGEIVVKGLGHHRTQGINNGFVVDIQAAADCIRATLHEAEQNAERRIKKVSVNFNAGDPQCVIRQAKSDVSSHEINDDDIHHLYSEALLQSRRVGYSILHDIPLRFSIDGSASIRDPRGMYGQNLMVEILHVMVKSGALHSLIRCVNLCDVEVESVIISPYAAALACLEEDERHLGAVCIDLGGGVTGLAIMLDNRLIYVDTLPIGGTHITHDIARGLGVGIATAERLKTVHGSVLPNENDDHNMIDIPLLGGDSHRVCASLLNGIIRPRLEEILELARDRIETSGYNAVIGDRVILTGGGSLLRGMRERATLILNRRTRIGQPQPLQGLPKEVANPAFATNIGLAILRLPPMRQFLTESTFGHHPMGKFLHRISLWSRAGF